MGCFEVCVNHWMRTLNRGIHAQDNKIKVHSRCEQTTNINFALKTSKHNTCSSIQHLYKPFRLTRKPSDYNGFHFSCLYKTTTISSSSSSSSNGSSSNSRSSSTKMSSFICCSFCLIQQMTTLKHRFTDVWTWAEWLRVKSYTNSVYLWSST